MITPKSVEVLIEFVGQQVVLALQLQRKC